MALHKSKSGVLASYLTLIFRNFYKNRFYTLINLFGLSVGFLALIYTVLYVYFETHFENFHQQSAQIYRVTHQFQSGDNFNVHWARVPHTYINELPNDIPAVKKLIRFQNRERKYVRIEQEKFRPQHAYVTDKEVFDVFDFKLIAGDARTALAEPRSVVISKALGKKYFGDADPLNKEIFVIGDLETEEIPHRITGVMADLSPNTHLPVDMLISFKDKSERAGWAYTYVLLEDGIAPREVESKFPAFIKKYDDPATSSGLKFMLQPIQDIHLNSDLAREIVPNGKIFYVKIVGFGGLFILIIAVINFMNLNSAMALGRAKEIGMRKVMGASREQLTAYLFMESVVNHLIALFIGAVAAYLAFPLLQRFIPVAVLIDYSLLAIFLFAVAIGCGVLSGIYPVLLLVTLRPMDTVRTNKTFSFARKEGPFTLKRVMVTLQFCISIMFGGSAIVAYHQFQFLTKQNLGVSREQVIAIPGVPDKVKDNFKSFKTSLSNVAGVNGVTACMEVPSREIRDSGPVLVDGVTNDPTTAPMMDIQVIEPDFVKLLNIELLAGDNIPQHLVDANVPAFTDDYPFTKYLAEAERAYLINETAMKQLGWKTPDEAIGQRINWSNSGLELAHGPIKGVVKDFHQETLKNRVDPLIMVYEPIWLRTFLVKLETKNIQETMKTIQQTWDVLFPQYPMEYFFLDDLYENLYKGERLQLQLLYVFSGLAIVIAFIGLIGLIAYALKTRVKEIAIRKVMGASVTDLVRLISREYLMILLIGGGLAIPLSVYGLTQWLSTFAYHVDISALSYVFVFALMALLLLITIGLQTLRTSSANPSDVLRDD